MHTQNDFLQHSNSAGAAWRDRLLTAGAAIIIGLSLSNTAPADQTEREMKRSADVKHDATVREAKANYKADRAKCKELTGNDKDVCIKEAKAAEKRAKADAKAQKKTTGANAEANEEKREAEFKVAKEKCDSMTGNTKNTCEKEAEAKYRQ